MTYAYKIMNLIVILDLSSVYCTKCRGASQIDECRLQISKTAPAVDSKISMS